MTWLLVFTSFVIPFSTKRGTHVYMHITNITLEEKCGYFRWNKQLRLFHRLTPLICDKTKTGEWKHSALYSVWFDAPGTACKTMWQRLLHLNRTLPSWLVLLLISCSASQLMTQQDHFSVFYDVDIFSILLSTGEIPCSVDTQPQSITLTLNVFLPWIYCPIIYLSVSYLCGCWNVQS